jgi:hypothetical protein
MECRATNVAKAGHSGGPSQEATRTVCPLRVRVPLGGIAPPALPVKALGGGRTTLDAEGPGASGPL